MPIKFSCPQCKNVMTVDSKFAGKNGKCNKCGGVVQVPAQDAQVSGAAKPVAAGSAGVPTASAAATTKQAPAAGSLGAVFDELTESDFNRQSPFTQVYAPAKPKSENNQLLKKAAELEKKETGMHSSPQKNADPNQLSKQLQSLGLVDVLAGIGNYSLAIALAVVGVNGLGEHADKIPFLGKGPAVAVIVGGFLGTAFMAAGMGIFTRQVWGYVLANGVHAFNVSFTLLMLLANITNTTAVSVRSGPVVATIAMATFFFREVGKKPFGIKSGSKLPFLVGGIGLALGLIVGGLLMVLGVFTPHTAST
jgi:hypothetical protein